MEKKESEDPPRGDGEGGKTLTRGTLPLQDKQGVRKREALTSDGQRANIGSDKEAGSREVPKKKVGTVFPGHSKEQRTLVLRFEEQQDQIGTRGVVILR